VQQAGQSDFDTGALLNISAASALVACGAAGGLRRLRRSRCGTKYSSTAAMSTTNSTSEKPIAIAGGMLVPHVSPQQGESSC
jgi:hypothetical protein